MGVACLVKNENLDQTKMFGLAVRALGTPSSKPFYGQIYSDPEKNYSICQFLSEAGKCSNNSIICDDIDSLQSVSPDGYNVTRPYLARAYTIYDITQCVQ